MVSNAVFSFAYSLGEIMTAGAKPFVSFPSMSSKNSEGVRILVSFAEYPQYPPKEIMPATLQNSIRGTATLGPHRLMAQPLKRLTKANEIKKPLLVLFERFFKLIGIPPLLSCYSTQPEGAFLVFDS